MFIYFRSLTSSLFPADDTRVLVYDFGSEVYVWNGRSAPFESRRIGLKLAKDYFDDAKNNKDFAAKHPLLLDPSTQSGAGGSARPDWTILGKVNQNMETILFREKFANWPQVSPISF